MTTTQNYTPFPEIIAELRRLCTKKATGTMFIATKANRSAQLILNKGKLVFVYFFNKRGVEALELMSTIIAGRYRFQEGIDSRRTPLPPTDEILQSLSNGQQVTCQVSESPSTESTLSEEQKTVLVKCFAVFVGPMAGVISDDHLDIVANLQEAVDALVTEIPSPEQAEKFRQMVHEKLG